jgi:hypothetical protein
VRRMWKAAVVACAALTLDFVAGAHSPAIASNDGVCSARVNHSVVPAWARAGFSSPNPRVPYVLGRSARIVAILFGYPLRSPLAPHRSNKILWVARTPATTQTALWIHAQRMAGAKPVGAPIEHLVRDGPGPSYVNVPQPGCWRLTLSWAGRTDSLDLAYSTGS